MDGYSERKSKPHICLNIKIDWIRKVKLKEKTAIIEDTNTRVKETNTSLATVDELSIEEIQLSDQIYHGAGLGPIVDAGIKDYDHKIEQEK